MGPVFLAHFFGSSGCTFQFMGPVFLYSTFFKSFQAKFGISIRGSVKASVRLALGLGFRFTFYI